LAEFSTRGKIGPVKWALTGLGGGAGLALGLAAMKLIQERPEFLPQLLNSGFLFFTALVVGMVVASRKADAFVAMSHAMQERSVVANERLAQSVGDLALKDDQRAREQEITLNHLARKSEQHSTQNEEILKLLKEVKANKQ
jgi:hypothetical protein